MLFKKKKRYYSVNYENNIYYFEDGRFFGPHLQTDIPAKEQKYYICCMTHPRTNKYEEQSVKQIIKFNNWVRTHMCGL